MTPEELAEEIAYRKSQESRNARTKGPAKAKAPPG